MNMNMNMNDWYALTCFKYADISYITYIRLVNTFETGHVFEYKTEQIPADKLIDEFNKSSNVNIFNNKINI